MNLKLSSDNKFYLKLRYLFISVKCDIINMEKNKEQGHNIMNKNIFLIITFMLINLIFHFIV